MNLPALKAGLRSLAILAGLCIGGASAPAVAHPHVWFTVTVAPTFDDAHRLSSVHQKWYFDYDYSLLVGSQLDQNGDGTFSVDELIKTLTGDGALSWILNKDFFTLVTVGGQKVGHGPAQDVSVGVTDAKLVVEFTLPLAEPQVATLGAGIDVFDPEFYYDIEFDYPDVEAPTAPATCQVAVRERDNLDPVAIMIIRKLGLTADPRVLSDPAAGYAVRVAIDCK
jgi:ABC-type uncharacterized transport system substrate-binding protein